MFEQTPIGYLIQHECPIEWAIICDIKQIRGVSINADFLEHFAYSSENPVFKTEKFRRALIDFREYGCATPNRIDFDLDEELRLIKEKLENKNTLGL